MAPIDVISDPSLSATTPRSSLVIPNVICSGAPSGKRWRHRCDSPDAATAKYIQRPSGDHAAAVQEAWDGPTEIPEEELSNGTSRQGSHPFVSISTTSTQRPSGER